MTFGKLTDPKMIIDFTLGGRSRFTLVSKSTGTRFTFKVAKTDREDNVFFVSGLCGPNNETDYRYLGLLRRDPVGGMRFFDDKKNRIAPDSPIRLAWKWLFAKLLIGSSFEIDKFLTQTEFWHEGRCARCGRALTDPESIRTGFGPICGDR